MPGGARDARAPPCFGKREDRHTSIHIPGINGKDSYSSTVPEALLKVAGPSGIPSQNIASSTLLPLVLTYLKKEIFLKNKKFNIDYYRKILT